MKSAIVIGSGFGGISAAAYLAKLGYRVTVLEKNNWVGGRAQLLSAEGFNFDMGPSWYWMPDEHDAWFTDFGVRRESYYGVRRVEPSYKAYFDPAIAGPAEVEMPTDRARAVALFESIEAGAGRNLERYLEQSRAKYELAMSRFIYKNYYRITDFLNPAVLAHAGTLDLTSSYGGVLRRFFKHPHLIKMLEFPVVFLGSSASRTPAMYTLMNHIDFGLGTWYPDGGFAAVVRAMQSVAESVGVQFRFEHEVTALDVEGGTVTALNVRTPGGMERLSADVVVANADYVHVETALLPPHARSLSPARVERLRLAPSVMNYYIGFDRPIEQFAHHTFFFDADWDANFDAVYEHPRHAERPLFYLHVPSKTDPNAAPAGKEAVFLLVPVAPGLEDTPEIRNRYRDLAVQRMEERTGVPLRSHIIFERSYSINDFRRDYNAFRGNAFGLGQTLFQTAYFRPANRSRRVGNLYFAGQYTVPGTGTTMSMISGKVVADRIKTELGA